MSVLFSRPSSDPFAPTLGFSFADAFNINQPTFIGWQGFFGNDITHQNCHIIVWQLLALLLDFLDFFYKIRMVAFRQKIGGLPVRIDIFQVFIDFLVDLLRQKLHYFNPARLHGIGD